MITLEDILKELGAKKPFKQDGNLSESGYKAYEKLMTITTGLYSIGAIREKPDNIESYCDEIIRLGF